MRRLVFLVIMVLLSQLAEAKTILYVTNASTDTPCSSLQATDSLYCNRLTNLGYTVNVINELHARDNSTTWNEYANNPDMIFLGSDSLDMAKNASRDAFCGNIISRGKPIFFTSVNTWISRPSIKGCAFYDNLVNFSFSDNKCPSKTFRIAKAGLITEGFDINENITIYPSIKIAKFYDISDEGWITSECVPPNGSIDFYPVLFTSDKGVFWGLDESSSFSNATWEIFDKVVLSLLNDYNWPIEAFSLPSISTANQTTLIFAKVTQNGVPVKGIVNYTVGSIVGSMNYDSLWKSSINFSREGMYNLNLNAYSSYLRGFAILPITVGNLAVGITSGNFKPNSNYIVSAEIEGVDSASYRILNASDYGTLLGGVLICKNSICTGVVGAMPDANSLLLEVTASGSSSGGALKTINREILATDKNVYKPGDVIGIDFFPNKTVQSANLTIIRPDGTKETPSPLQMDLISENHWNKRYSLGEGCLNGTWIINLKTKNDEYNKSIDIIAWKPFAYLNKNSFSAFENVVLYFGTIDAYSNNADIDVLAGTTNSGGSNITLGHTSIKGNSISNFSYLISSDYPSGVSSVKISFKDSSNRSSDLYLNFSTNITFLGPSLFVTPSTVSITTIEGKLVEKPFIIENDAQIKTPNIVTNVSGLDINVEWPSFLEAKSNSDGKIKINTTGLGEGTYAGYVSFYSSVGNATIAVSLEIVGDFSAQASDKYSKLSSIESNITYLSKGWTNTTDALQLLSDVKAALNETINDYKNENYALAKTKFEEASTKFTELESEVNNLQVKQPDYSFIVWYFALAVVVVIVTITFVKLRGRKKKPKKAKEKETPPKQEQPKKEVYFEPKGGEYRTEYY